MQPELKHAINSNSSRLCFLLAFTVLAIGSAIAQVRPFASPRHRLLTVDHADLAMVARNIAEGNGPVVDCIWDLQYDLGVKSELGTVDASTLGLPGDHVRHPEAYYSIYVAALWAPFFLLFGPTMQTIWLVGCLVKTAIAGLGSLWTYRLTHSYLATTASASILLLHPVMTDRVNGQSDIYLSFCILAAMTIAAYSWFRGSAVGAFATGILAGLAIGAKPSGMLMLVLLPSIALLHQDRWRLLRQLWIVALGIALAVSPLCFHNYTSYGVIYWPALPIIREHGLVVQGWNPANTGVVRALKRFVERVLEGGFDVYGKKKFLPVWMLPFLSYAFWDTTHTYFRRRGECKSDEFIFVSSTFLLGCAGIFQAASIHVEWRYWNFIVPFAVVTTIVICTRLSIVFVWFALLISLFVGFDNLWELRRQEIRPVPATFKTVMDIVPAEAVVMTQPVRSFSFHTRRKSVIIPRTADEDLILGIAERYQIEYLVLIRTWQPHLRHDYFNFIASGNFPDWLQEVYFDGDLLIGRIRKP